MLGLGLEHSCPWLRECLSSERLSLALDFFCVLGLEPCVLDSTSANKSTDHTAYRLHSRAGLLQLERIPQALKRTT